MITALASQSTRERNGQTCRCCVIWQKIWLLVEIPTKYPRRQYLSWELQSVQPSKYRTLSLTREIYIEDGTETIIISSTSETQGIGVKLWPGKCWRIYQEWPKSCSTCVIMYSQIGLESKDWGYSLKLLRPEQQIVRRTNTKVFMPTDVNGDHPYLLGFWLSKFFMISREDGKLIYSSILLVSLICVARLLWIPP